jgi:hypothetical protein
MSMYYSPEIVKLLNDERIREIQRARLAGTRSVHATRRPQLADQLRRLFVRQPAPTTCAC